jgi:hypothetical protein
MKRRTTSPPPKPREPQRIKRERANGKPAALPPHRERMRERGQGMIEDERGQEEPADRKRALRNR